MAANDWPKGCLGYAFNLVRPVQPGHRATVLYCLLGQTLVFETLADAERYREFLTQARRAEPVCCCCRGAGTVSKAGAGCRCLARPSLAD